MCGHLICGDEQTVTFKIKICSQMHCHKPDQSRKMRHMLYLLSFNRPSGMAIENNTGKLTKANKPGLTIKSKNDLTTGYPNTGINLAISSLANPLPVPNIMPHTLSRAIGYINALPGSEKNSGLFLFHINCLVIR